MATSKEVPPFPLLNASKEGEDSNMESSPSIEHDSSFLIMDISLEESHQLASLNNELEQILDIKVRTQRSCDHISRDIELSKYPAPYTQHVSVGMPRPPIGRDRGH